MNRIGKGIEKELVMEIKKSGRIVRVVHRNKMDF